MSTHTQVGLAKPGEDGWLRTLPSLPEGVTLPTMYTTGTPEYLHAAVCHGHGIISQRVTGYLAIIGAGGWCKGIARTHVVWIHRIVPLEGPAGEVQQQCIAESHWKPRTTWCTAPTC